MNDETPEFIDTNILLYAYDRSAGARHSRAAELVGELGAHRRAAVSTQVLQEFFVNATRKIAQPLVSETAIERLRVFSRWRVHIPDPEDVVAAAISSESNQLSFWDAMIIQSASALGCQTLWSEDLSDGQQFGQVTVRNPFG